MRHLLCPSVECYKLQVRLHKFDHTHISSSQFPIQKEDLTLVIWHKTTQNMPNMTWSVIPFPLWALQLSPPSIPRTYATSNNNHLIARISIKYSLFFFQLRFKQGENIIRNFFRTFPRGHLGFFAKNFNYYSDFSYFSSLPPSFLPSPPHSSISSYLVFQLPATLNIFILFNWKMK